MNQKETEATAKPSACADLFCFRWWYKGKTPEGNIMRLEGKIVAKDSYEAARSVEKQMRARWPQVKWMQGRDTEGEGDWKGVTFGPTTQRLKRPVKPSKQNAQPCRGEGKEI